MESDLILNENENILTALKQMDLVKRKLLIIVNKENEVVNLLSIGDIQRAIISNGNLQLKINEILIEKKIIGNISWTIENVKNKMKELRSDYMPIVDSQKKLNNIYFWEDIFEEKKTRYKENDVKLPVVIMAGGKGTRLKPISNVLPKPLIPIGEKTIIEEIISRFTDFGCESFFISVNYKKELIEYYLNSTNSSKQIEYFSEDSPLGTAGSLSLLKGKINKTFFVTNCDILIDQDLNEMFKYHQENENDITIVAALKHISIPYGIIRTGDNGILEEMEEKPELTLKINAGVYLLEPKVLDVIPQNKFYHITELIDDMKEKGGRVGVFPISEKSWLDIGEWPEYIKTVKALHNEDSFVGIL